MQAVGVVAEVRRYPVKSLGGEVLRAVDVDARGVAGDRRWAVVDADGKLGSSKSTRRFRRMDGLLELTTIDGDGGVDGATGPFIGFPDGRQIGVTDPQVHEALSAHVGRPVTLHAEADVTHFDDGPIHLVTSASLTALTAEHGAPVSLARLRGNLLVDVGEADGFVEDGWVGRTLAVGDEVMLRIREPMPRCVMVDQAQAELPAAPGLLGAIGRVNDARVGSVVEVVRPGRIRVGDPVRVEGRVPVGRAPRAGDG